MGQTCPLIVLGAGGHASVVIEIARAMDPDRRIFAFDQTPRSSQILGLDIITGLPDAELFPPNEFSAVVAIGHCATRDQLSAWLAEAGYRLETLAHPTAWVSPSATIEGGTVVSAKAVVNARAAIGRSCIINSGAIVEHDCKIGDAAHICPGAVLAGEVSIGRRTMVGANATIKELCRLGDDVTIGAGSVVVRDLPHPATYIGSPARAKT